MEIVMNEKGKAISLRIEEEMKQLLDEQAKEWNKSTSETVRTILGYFLTPKLYDKRWEAMLEDSSKVYEGAEQRERNAKSLEEFMKESYEYIAPLAKLLVETHSSYEHLLEEVSKHSYFSLKELEKFAVAMGVPEPENLVDILVNKRNEKKVLE
jgi:hypothetical protein